MASSLWKVRPSALTSAVNVYTDQFSRGPLTNHYEFDNQRAIRDGVEVLERHESSKLRTLQWNVNSGYYTSRGRTLADVQRGLADAIQDADADVLVLNEYFRTNAHTAKLRPFEENGHTAKLRSFEEDLEDIGYSFVFCGAVDYPTAVATRLRVRRSEEVRLSEDRSALLIQVRTDDGSSAWVIGTHINFADGGQRLREMQVLAEYLERMFLVDDGEPDGEEPERVVMAGDLNQQRERDYAPEEWERIRSGMEARGSPADDGVARLLADRGFACAWDPADERGRSCDASPVVANWETPHAPATHWSGTIVDYSYGRNVSPVAVSISPAGWSDHRMTVCDWTW